MHNERSPFWRIPPPPPVSPTGLPGVVLPSLWMSGSLYELWTKIPTGSPVATDGLMGKAARLGSAVDGHLLCEGAAAVCVMCCTSSCPLLAVLSSVWHKGKMEERFLHVNRCSFLELLGLWQQETTNVSSILCPNNHLPIGVWSYP